MIGVGQLVAEEHVQPPERSLAAVSLLANFAEE